MTERDGQIEEELRHYWADVTARIWANQDAKGLPRSDFAPMLPVSRAEYVTDLGRIQCLDGRWHTSTDFLKSGKLRKGARGFTTEELLQDWDRTAAAGYVCTTHGWYSNTWLCPVLDSVPYC